MKDQRKTKKISKKAKTWIAVGVIVAAIAIVGIAIAVALAQENGAICPDGWHRSCAPLGGGEERCTCVKDGSMTIDAKPIIYLYPKEETEVTVRLGLPEKLLVSYPRYNGDGWEVLAEPNGKLTDLDTGRELYSLYWEGANLSFDVTNEGFVVKREEAVNFLEEKLSVLGLNEREVEEFIIYWLPKMQENKYSYVRFATREEIEKYMPLEVAPQPDTTIRILMLTKGLDEPMDVREQELGPTPDRNGFTVVEWGGSLTK